MIPESFQTDKNMEGMRSITLFWKAVPFEYHNGKDFHYLVEHQRIAKRHSRDINHLNEINDNPIRTHNTSYTFNHMKSDWTYSFSVYGVNSMGKSSNYSQIIVESNDLIPHKPTNIDVYSFGGGRYEVQWSKPRISQANYQFVNYTVFWCKNLRPRPFPCEGPIDWVHTKNLSIALELPDIATNYQFAVSANTDSSSSGMSWAECIVPINGRLDKLSDVSLKVINSTSINVIWKLNCPAQRRVVEGYKINYCVTRDNTCSGCEKLDSVEVDNSAENFILSDLEPFTRYKVTVLAYSDLGPSEESDRRCDQTLSASPRDAPSHLRVIVQTEDSIGISWQVPSVPNGIIDHYLISSNASETPFKVTSHFCNSSSCSFTMRNLKSYRWHELRVKACHSGIYCSPASPILVTHTLESYPSQMVPPRSEVINSTSVRIMWSAPVVANGPINYYSIKVIRSDNSTEVFNISGKSNDFYLSLDCDSSVDSSIDFRPQYAVQIAAVNLRENRHLMAVYSESTNLNACLLLSSDSWFYILGLVGGTALGLIILVLVLVVLIKWMKKRINTYRELQIDLPKGLEVPRLVTDERDNSDTFHGFERNDSFKNINSELLDEENDSFKNRHGSGLSHTSNSSTELLFKNNSNKKGDSLFRMTSHDSGQQESISSHCSTEAHTSDSGVEVESQQNSLLNEIQRHLKANPQPSLAIVDELVNNDSSGSKDSGLEVNSGARSKKTKKRTKGLNLINSSKISAIVMPPGRNEVMNPLYDNPMSHSVCVYSLLANSEPSLVEVPAREDHNILSDMTKFTKPEMAKSLSNIIQSYSPSDPKIGCIICETNNSSRSSSRNSSPNCPYYKYGMKRQNHNQNAFVATFTPEKQRTKVTKTNNGYITIDSLPPNGQIVSMNPKKKLEHDWSQSSYDAEVSSTSSNGDNEQTEVTQGCIQDNLFTKSRLSFTDCQKIQNNSSFEDNTELNVIELNDSSNHQIMASTDSVAECETQLSVVKELNTPVEDTTQLKSSVTSGSLLAKDSNGYVLHNAISQSNCSQAKPTLIKNANGYVIRDGIEMNGLVPNSNLVNVTQV